MDLGIVWSKVDVVLVAIVLKIVPQSMIEHNRMGCFLFGGEKMRNLYPCLFLGLLIGILVT